MYQKSASEMWMPGRIIDGNNPIYAKIASILTYARQESIRYLPVGTPVYDRVSPDAVRLVARDSDWDPYEVRPFMDPPEYALLGGIPGFSTPGMPGLSHVGAYLPGVDYHEGDPAWVWENTDGWRRAIVISGQRSWVAVRYVDGYRLPDGRTSKSYRPAKVWPVICDHPDLPQGIEVRGEWARIADYHVARMIMGQLGNVTRLGRNPGL
jgi:hypothetical protein